MSEQKTVGELIAEGRLDEAESLLNRAGSGKEDTMASALLADVRVGQAEKLAGQRPSMQLTKSGAFSAEERAPFDFRQALQERSRKDISADREDRRLRIMSNQFRINKKLDMEKMKELRDKTDRMLEMQDKGNQIRIISTILDSLKAAMSLPGATTDVINQKDALMRYYQKELSKLR